MHSCLLRMSVQRYGHTSVYHQNICFTAINTYPVSFEKKNNCVPVQFLAGKITKREWKPLSVGNKNSDEDLAESRDCLRTGMLLPEGKRWFRSFAWGVFEYPEYSPRLGPQVILTYFQHWRNILVGRLFRSDEKNGEWRQGVVKCIGDGGLRRRRTKTRHRLWQVPECWWQLRRRIT